MNTIQQAWETFERDVVPKDAGRVQRTEMKRAFYAGATAALSVTSAIGEHGISEDAGVAILEGLHQEVIRFSGNPF